MKENIPVFSRFFWRGIWSGFRWGLRGYHGRLLQERIFVDLYPELQKHHPEMDFAGLRQDFLEAWEELNTHGEETH